MSLRAWAKLVWPWRHISGLKGKLDLMTKNYNAADTQRNVRATEIDKQRRQIAELERRLAECDAEKFRIWEAGAGLIARAEAAEQERDEARKEEFYADGLLAEQTKALVERNADVNVLAEAIRKAPHYCTPRDNWRCGVYNGHDCNCWKSRALAAPEAIIPPSC